MLKARVLVEPARLASTQIVAALLYVRHVHVAGSKINQSRVLVRAVI